MSEQKEPRHDKSTTARSISTELLNHAEERRRVRQFEYPDGLWTAQGTPTITPEVESPSSAILWTKPGTKAKVCQLLELKKTENLHFHEKLQAKREFSRPGFELNQAYKLGLIEESQWQYAKHLPIEGKYENIYKRVKDRERTEKEGK